MDKRLFIAIYVSFILLLFSVLFNKSIESQIKIISSLFFIIITFIFYIKLEKLFSEDKPKNEKESKEKTKQKEEENKKLIKETKVHIE